MPGGRVPKAACAATPSPVGFENQLPAADSGLIVGVIDTGLIKTDGRVHPWLIGHVNERGDNQDPTPGSPSDLGVDDGHGTFVAGLILREAQHASVRMIRAIDVDEPAGGLDRTVVAGIHALIGDPAVKVINLSFGGQIWETLPPRGLRDAIGAAGEEGMVVVAPAGNLPTGDEAWPAAFAYEFDHVVSVGAVDETPTYLHGRPPPRAAFSNYGYWVKAFAGGVDVLGPFYDFTGIAPGTDTFAGWARWSGTSFAAAIVAGVIARTSIDNNVSVVDAVAQVLDKRTHMIREDGWALPAAYVPATGSSWSLAPRTEPADRSTDADG